MKAWSLHFWSGPVELSKNLPNVVLKQSLQWTQWLCPIVGYTPKTIAIKTKAQLTGKYCSLSTHHFRNLPDQWISTIEQLPKLLDWWLIGSSFSTLWEGPQAPWEFCYAPPCYDSSWDMQTPLSSDFVPTPFFCRDHRFVGYFDMMCWCKWQCGPHTRMFYHKYDHFGNWAQFLGVLDLWGHAHRS